VRSLVIPARSIATAAAVLVATLPGCVTPRTNEQVIRESAQGDPRLEEACTVTVRVCTRCHDLNRVMATRMDSPQGWPPLVARMRFMQSSAMTEADADLALTCLVFRQFGQPGLDAIATATAASASATHGATP
jgi:hypothetical protein